MTDDLHDLAAAYALDALDAADRERFERHLEGCDACQADVASFQEVVTRVGVAQETLPPETLKARVMADLDPSRKPPRKRASWRQRAFIPVVAALAAVVLALAGVVAATRATGDRASEILAAPDAQLAVLEGPSVARLVYSIAEEAGVLAMSGVEDLPGASTYQLWLIEEAGPVPAGTFRPDNGTVGFLVEGDFGAADAAGITIEPAGGSLQPTREILYLGKLG
ncbi:MAG: anti-sigma factor domain-containing protein [Acidimicrobiia bacterium]